ncbi:MAG: mersacidin/lichenicidin family type 2 lantibiotic [Nostoc sp. ChiSLP02]|nr:mersacidin/lichenicidin family type 2 lantibiotic [Nostoc sp. DedSLP05]MDZ8102335.1 mersacidin/lichenicidin family type 2 lantibiotic [Nostoc sp. DedSLP01]MDZ8188410.1 mersacidin/lichenicidin family type 2 lantibiotic [Nostoc sp. ChiSLP02]
MGNININDIDVVRAWKDEEYRSSLTEAQRAQIPDNPAGLVDLTDEEINGIEGGFSFHISGGRVCTVTAECGCPSTVTGRCRCPF